MGNLLSYLHENLLEAGCDEAGRGCLAGPVVAAAVILPHNFEHDWLNDSKKLSEQKRRILAPIIKENALAFGIGIVSEIEIDEINILNASFLAMHRAIDALKVNPEHLLIDGNRFNAYPNINHTCIIQGDGKMKSIAAASIIAKTFRDELMEGLHLEFPFYGWDKNKAYPTLDHRAGIVRHGPCKYHRKTFTLLKVTQEKC